MRIAPALLSCLSCLGCLVVGLSACTTLSPNVPSSFDLSGHWVLDEVASDAAPDLDAIRQREDRDVARGRQSNPSGSAAFVVQDFPILEATTLLIEQDAASMGIRYDGDTYRDVTWGIRERDFWTVRSGWQDGALVIRSTRGSTKGLEILALADGGSRLRVTVHVDTDGENVRAVRLFTRP